MVYQLMELEQISRAEKAGLHYAEKCEPMYQLATDKHKSAINTQLAFVNLEEHMLEVLRLYIKHVRPNPSKESVKRFLFINNNGHQIFKPSTDLTRVLEHYENELAHNSYYNDFRTLSNMYYMYTKQEIINKTIAHSAVVVDTFYVISSAQAKTSLILFNQWSESLLSKPRVL